MARINKELWLKIELFANWTRIASIELLFKLYQMETMNLVSKIK